MHVADIITSKRASCLQAGGMRSIPVLTPDTIGEVLLQYLSRMPSWLNTMLLLTTVVSHTTFNYCLVLLLLGRLLFNHIQGLPFPFEKFKLGSFSIPKVHS